VRQPLKAAGLRKFFKEKRGYTLRVGRRFFFALPGRLTPGFRSAIRLTILKTDGITFMINVSNSKTSMTSLPSG